MNWKATIAFLLLAGSAFAQTATPTNTPTATPTNTPAPTNTPLPTATPVNPFTTDYLTINKLTGILYGNGTSPVTVVTFTPASTPTNTPTNTPTPTATPTFTPVATATPGIAYSLIENQNTPLPTRTIANFIGPYVTCVDNSGASRTDCTWVTPTPRATDTPAFTPTVVPGLATPTPLVFSTPGDLVIFSATELGDYAGSSTCAAGSLVVSISKAGAVTCATPVPPTAVPTATPRATDTPANTPTPENPFGNLSYSGKLNVTGNTAISASATPAAGDRSIYCSSSGGSVTYTMPAATGSFRVIDEWKVDTGNSCIMSRAGSDTLNGATTLTLSTRYNHETCIDQASTVWLCTGDGT